MTTPNAGVAMHALATRLWSINRSLTGPGVRETLAILAEHLPGLERHEVPSGTPAFDWIVPPEWRCREAWLEGPDGRRIVDYARNNLSVVGYSRAIAGEFTRTEIDSHLHSLPEFPEATPYVTSYYQDRWGFCLPHVTRCALPEGVYRAHIDSEHNPQGSMSYGEFVLPGETTDEILLSTYVCHPSMANNELSGPCLATYLGRWLSSRPRRRYTYRLLFLPETIGSITYLSRHLTHLRQHVRAGFVITCGGDERTWSYLPSRRGDTLADRAVLHVLERSGIPFTRYSFRDRGSDERQYCSPGVDLPVCSLMRSKYGTYPEYHTSADNLDLVTAAGLGQTLNALKTVIACLEDDRRWRSVLPCEPQLGKRGLFPTLGTRDHNRLIRLRLDLLAHADGEIGLLALAEHLGVTAWELAPIAAELASHHLLVCDELGHGPFDPELSSPIP